MVRIEEFILAARRLSPDDRAELLRRLLMETPPEDDADVGKRGLEALTESTRDDDWSPHYPPSLARHRRAG